MWKPLVIFMKVPYWDKVEERDPHNGMNGVYGVQMSGNWRYHLTEFRGLQNI